MQKIKVIIAGICIFSFNTFFSQNTSANVVFLDSMLTANQQLVNRLLKYKFILIGEMHGTQEPAKFLTQVVKALCRDKTVSVGFEIADDEINPGNKKPLDLLTIKHSAAFEKPVAGKNSQAWLDAIAELLPLKNCHVFFFDNTAAQSHLQRDSAMYLNIKKQFLQDTAAIVVTLSGNYHNRLKPTGGAKHMGCFLNVDYGGRILAVNHEYSYGTMYNQMSDGLHLRNVGEPADSIGKPQINYLYPDPLFELNPYYNAFLFTTKINASFPVKNE